MRSSWGSSSSTAAAGVKWDNASVHHKILHHITSLAQNVFKLVFNELQSLSPVQSRNIITLCTEQETSCDLAARSESVVALGTPGMCPLQVG